MKNIPEKIYLQMDDDELPEDFNQLEVTWCSDRINENDIAYIREPSSPTVKKSETSYEDAYREGWNDAIKHEKNIKESETVEQEEKILESHCGSDFYQLKEQRFLPHIISAMKEHAGIVAEQAFLAGRSKTSWNQFKKDMNP